MIELKQNDLVFTFPEVHEDAVLRIDFQRTLRIPDDDKTYPLPPGLGSFPLRHVDDFASGVPEQWLSRGGVLLPMYQSEAMWLNFSSDYPFAVKIAAGKINAVNGEEWKDDGLNPDEQDYVVVPGQPWLDGYCVDKGHIRQFVAMPLGSGYSAEEQLTGKAEHGGIQIVAYPIKPEVFERMRAVRSSGPEPMYQALDATMYSKGMGAPASAAPDMGLAPGGMMAQEIYDDHHDFENWKTDTFSRCFVHLTNSLVWRSITKEDPPTTPPTSAEYTRAGLPWFEYYDESKVALKGSERLKGLKSVFGLGKERSDVPLPENEPVDPNVVVTYRVGLKEDQVREGVF